MPINVLGAMPWLIREPPDPGLAFARGFNVLASYNQQKLQQQELAARNAQAQQRLDMERQRLAIEQAEEQRRQQDAAAELHAQEAIKQRYNELRQQRGRQKGGVENITPGEDAQDQMAAANYGAQFLPASHALRQYGLLSQQQIAHERALAQQMRENQRLQNQVDLLTIKGESRTTQEKNARTLIDLENKAAQAEAAGDPNAAGLRRQAEALREMTKRSTSPSDFRVINNPPLGPNQSALGPGGRVYTAFELLPKDVKDEHDSAMNSIKARTKDLDIREQTAMLDPLLDDATRKKQLDAIEAQRAKLNEEKQEVYRKIRKEMPKVDVQGPPMGTSPSGGVGYMPMPLLQSPQDIQAMTGTPEPIPVTPVPAAALAPRAGLVPAAPWQDELANAAGAVPPQQAPPQFSAPVLPPAGYRGKMDGANPDHRRMAQEYLKTANGNKELARELARRDGWDVPE